MNSTILDNFGISDPGILIIILFVITVILLVLLIFLLVRYNQLNVSYQMFMKGKNAESLEEEIGALFNDISSLKTSTEKNRKDIKKIIENLSECYQRVGIVKYDAFPQMGGKLSFSLAMLDEKYNGYIINSVHGSDGCYTYSKEIKGGRCDLELGEEEKKALGMAMQM